MNDSPINKAARALLFAGLRRDAQSNRVNVLLKKTDSHRAQLEKETETLQALKEDVKTKLESLERARNGTL